MLWKRTDNSFHSTVASCKITVESAGNVFPVLSTVKKQKYFHSACVCHSALANKNNPFNQVYVNHVYLTSVIVMFGFPDVDINEQVRFGNQVMATVWRHTSL